MKYETFHKKKKLLAKFSSVVSPQAGITLLLSVLILSGLILVTLAVAGFTIQEIRASRAEIVSEPAIDAAESGAEEAIWSLKRNGNTTVPDCAASNVSQNFSSSNAALSFCKAYSGNDYTVNAGKATVFLLYDPNDFKGDADLSGYPYSSLSLTNKSEAISVSVDVSRIDGTHISSLVLNHGETQSVTIPPVTTGSEGRVQVSMMVASSAATVFATTYYNGVEKGLPDSLNLDSSGCSSKNSISGCIASGQELFSRKIQVILHTPQ